MEEKFHTEIYAYVSPDGEKLYGFKVFDPEKRDILIYHTKGFGSVPEAERNLNAVVGWLQG